MMIIKTRLFPFRLKLSEGKPVKLEIELKNNSEFKKIISLELLVDGLSLDQIRNIKKTEKRIGVISPFQTISFSYFIFPTENTIPGRYEITIKVKEHYLNYEYVIREWKKETSLRVVE